MMNGFFINSTNVSRTLISLYTGTYIVLFMEKSIDLRNFGKVGFHYLRVSE